MYRTLPIEEAVGRVLAHDLTEVRGREFKGPAFRKGHRIRAEDLCHLQRMGKRHIYVLEIPEGHLHEDEAAVALATAFCGEGVAWEGPPREGKLVLRAARRGLLRVAVEALAEVNGLGEVMCASRHGNTVVAAGDAVAATRAIPLVVARGVVERAAALAAAQGGLFAVRPLRRARAGIVITGHEIFQGLVEDRFAPLLEAKLAALGSEVREVVVAPDDTRVIGGHLRRLAAEGVDLILTTGGLSVDPDDVTRQAIASAGGEVLVYGAPVLPGAMFLAARLGAVPVLGIPACGVHHAATVLDLLLPRVLAGETLTRSALARMGHGGLCLDCPECRFPICPFGR